MPTTDPHAGPTSPEPVRLAVVGALGYGLVHLRTLHDLAAGDGARLVAAVDVRPLSGEAAELAGHVPYFPDLDALLRADRPDVIALATPIPTHAPLAITAMRAGCDVLLEKPPTASFAEYERLLEVMQETGRTCQVGFQSNGSDAYATIASALAEGEIGDVTGIGVDGAWVRPVSYYERARWAGRRRLDGVDVVDGVVTNPLAHAVATALRIDGSSRADDVAVVETELFHANDIEADDTSAVRILTTRGTTIALGLTLCAAEAREPRVIVHGTRGRITFRYTTDVVELDGVRGRRVVQCRSTPLLVNLVDHLRDPGVALLSPLAETGGFMRVLEAVRTAPDPAPVPESLVEWRTDDVGRHAVVRDVERWCDRVATEMRTFTTLGAPWAPSDATLATLAVDGTEVARYVDGAGSSALDSPRPHLHPVRTLGGVTVSGQRPADHTWHAGVGLAVQDVAGHNLWGGPTYLPGRGYAWRPDHGRITHEEWLERSPETARLVERLAWRGHDGAVLLTEERTLTWAPADGGWELGVSSTLAEARGVDLPLGSPGSNGRDRGGYGGFFWRLPDCADVDVRTEGARGEDAVHGRVAPWVAWSATTGTGDFTLVLASGSSVSARDPWFVRVSAYPGIGSALAWDAPLVLPAAGRVTRDFRVLVADGRLSDADAAAAGERLAGDPRP